MTRSFRDMNLTEEALGGLSAGIVGTVIGFPLDLIKTRMQTSSKSSGPNSILGVALQIVRTEGGILALYRGILPPMVSLSILNTMGFTSYSFFRDVYGGTNGWDYRNGLAGMTGAPMFSVVSTVENLVKVCVCARACFDQTVRKWQHMTIRVVHLVLIDCVVHFPLALFRLVHHPVCVCVHASVWISLSISPYAPPRPSLVHNSHNDG